MSMKRFACGALAAVLLAVPALAADPGASLAEGGEQDMVIGGGAPGFQLPQQRTLDPVELYGTVTSVLENGLLLARGDEKGDVVLHVSEKTAVVDAVTGERRGLEDVKESDTIYAWASPAMTRSLPPQTSAMVIVCNIPQDFHVPTYLEVQRVSRKEDGTVSALTSGSIVLHMSEDTELFAYQTKDTVGLDSIQPGAKVLAWYSMVAMSMPAQTTPSKVMVFPYDYAGWLSLNGVDDVAVNGEKLELPAVPYVEDEELMLPVRSLAEALGCEVTWSAERPDQIEVEKDGRSLYTLTIGGDTAVVEGDMVTELTRTVTAREGVTSVAASDLASLHDLKVESWGITF